MIRLRNCNYPHYRASEGKILEIINRLGLKYPPVRWKDLYSSLFQKFVSSLGRFREVLLKVLESTYLT